MTKTIRFLTLLITVMLLLPFVACSKKPEDARVKLGQMNIPYTVDAFIEAANKGDNVVVKLFLDAGMKVDSPNKDGVTALIATASGGQPITAQILLDKGANINVKNSNGQTALFAAGFKGHIAVAQILLNNGADVNIKEVHGDTPLMFAAMNGHSRIVQDLLGRSAQIDDKNNDGYTALIWALQNGHAETAKVLLNKGVAVNVKTKNNLSALKLAQMRGYAEIVNLLKKAGALVAPVNIGGEKTINDSNAGEPSDYGKDKVIIVPADYNDSDLVVDSLKQEIPKHTGYNVELILLEGRSPFKAWQAAKKASAEPSVKERIVVDFSHKKKGWVFYYGKDDEYFIKYCYDDEVPGRVAKAIRTIFPKKQQTKLDKTP